MKKLFLYITIVISGLILFFGCYYFSRKYFRENSYKVIIKENSMITTGHDIIKNDVNNNENELKEQTISIGISNNRAVAVKKYTLGIVDGYVVVYFGDNDEIYEYTDISQEKLEIVNYDVDSLRDMEFDDRGDVFRFLESIDS